MRRALFLAFALMFASPAWAQIIGPNGSTPSSGPGSGTVTSVATGNGLTGGPITTTGTVSLPTATAAQILVENAGATAFAPVSLSADCTIAATGAITCLNSNGNAFTSAAFGTALNLTAPPAVGGGTPAAGTFTNLNAIDAEGVIGSGGTLTCKFATASVCTATVGGGNITLAIPTGMAAGQQYRLIMSSTASITVTPASTWKVGGYSNSGGIVTVGAFNSGASGTLRTIPFQYDGSTNVYIQGSLPYVEAATLNTTSLSISSDNAVGSMTRYPLNFGVTQLTALVANEHMGTYLLPKAVTVENATVDESNVTCAVNATVTCFDCGTTAGACTSGQTSTIWTSPAITSANTGLSVAGGSITTAAVAAAHYVTCEVTAGTCATFQVGVSLLARPQ